MKNNMRTNKILERNLYSYTTKDGKIMYYLILGFNKTTVYNQFSRGFGNYIISPKFYEDKKKGLSDYFDLILKSDSEVYYIYMFDNEKEVLNIPVKNNYIETYRYNEIRPYLKKLVKRIDKKEFQKWVLKSKMLGMYQKQIEFYTKDELIDSYIKEGEYPKADVYIKNYKSLRLKEGRIESDSIIIKKCYKTNQVWYIQCTTQDRKTALGYHLKTFKKSELLDMLDFINDIKTRNKGLVKYLVLKNSLELKKFDYASNIDKVMFFKGH